MNCEGSEKSDAAVHVQQVWESLTVLLQQAATLLLIHDESLQGKPRVVVNA